jgi:hypothetical protein
MERATRFTVAYNLYKRSLSGAHGFKTRILRREGEREAKGEDVGELVEGRPE